MATKKKTRKQTGMINLATLRRMAKKAFGDDTKVGEYPGNTWNIATTGTEGVCVDHANRAVARRMMKVALEAALKG